MENNATKTLIWIDAILCDAETDPEIIERYYQRFVHTIRTIGQQTLPDNVDVKFTVYLSRDKLSYVPRITALLGKMSSSLARSANVHIYDHPPGGYFLPQDPHVDQIKNPNKQPRRRETLFKDASSDVNFGLYDAVVRLSMDDDDVYFPGHLKQVAQASSALLDTRPGMVSAAGFYRSYLVHVADDEVTLEDVFFSKIIPGNKFFVVPREQFSRLPVLSPWSLPETIDEESVERFAANSVHLSLIRNNEPTFAYMRRAQNLSGQSKAGYIDKVHSRSSFTDEKTFLRIVAETSIPKALLEIVDEPLPRAFRLNCRRVGITSGEIRVSTNFSKVFDGTCRIAFYLMRGEERLDVRWYSSQETATFHTRLSGVSVRAFVKKDDKIIYRKLRARILG